MLKNLNGGLRGENQINTPAGVSGEKGIVQPCGLYLKEPNLRHPRASLKFVHHSSVQQRQQRREYLVQRILVLCLISQKKLRTLAMFKAA